MSEHNCNDCGHQHDCGEMEDILDLIGENGETLKARVLSFVEVDEQEYAVLEPIEDNDEEFDQIIIMRVESDGDEEYLESVEDEDEWDKAFEAFKEAASGEFYFEDDEDFDEDYDSEDDDEE